MFIQRKWDGKRFWKILLVLGFGKNGEKRLSRTIKKK